MLNVPHKIRARVFTTSAIKLSVDEYVKELLKLKSEFQKSDYVTLDPIYYSRSVRSIIRRHIGFLWNPVSQLAREARARAFAVLVSRFSTTRKTRSCSMESGNKHSCPFFLFICSRFMSEINSKCDEYFNCVMKPAHEECER